MKINKKGTRCLYPWNSGKTPLSFLRLKTLLVSVLAILLIFSTFSFGTKLKVDPGSQDPPMESQTEPSPRGNNSNLP